MPFSPKSHRQYLTATALLAATTLIVSACGGCEETPTTPDAGADASTPGPEDAGGDVAAPDADADAEPDVLMLPSLSAPVTARYDEAGVLHLKCETNRDCFVAQGYFHANDRFLQMDLTRHQTFGSLSQMVGFLIGFDSDVTWRTRTLSLDGEPLEDLYFAALSEETQDIFVAYSEGVNQWLDHAALGTHGAKLSEEYSSGLLYDVAQIPEWKPQHSLAPLFQLAYTYSGAIDVAVGDEAAVFDPAIISDLYATPAVVQSSVVLEAETALLQRRRSFPGERPWRRWLTPAASTLRKLGRTGDDFSSILFGDYVPGHGSNSWVVGKSATTSGGAILSNDPHLQITNPSIWYLVEMSSTEAGGDLHIAGASIPCGPGVVIGHNEHVAWGATIAYYDLADAYVETLRPDGVSVDRGGTPVELLRKEFEFNGKGSTTPRTATIEIVPGHGPIIAKDAEAKTAVAFRWVAQEPGTDVEFLPAIWRATSVDEVEAALDHVRMLNIAWTAADRTGSIGWYPKTLVPNRPWASAQMPSWLPLPGDGTAEWDGYLDAAQLPTLKDPAAGFIATTNNDFNGDWFDGDNTNDGHPPLQSLLSVGAGYRHSRVVERLRTEGPHNFDTIRDILADTHSVHGELLVPEVLLTTDTLDGLSADATAVVEALRAWRYTCPSALDGADPETAAIVSDAAVVRESAGCAAFHLFAVELTDTVFDELAAFAPQYDRHYWKDWQSTMVHLLVDPTALSYGTAYFDDVSTPAVETRSDAIRDALEATAVTIVEQYGSSDAGTWAWGRIHYLDHESLLGLPAYGEGPFVTSGGFQTVNMADPVSGNPGAQSAMRHQAGGSVRFIYELGADGVSAKFELPGGQVHHRDSPFYNSLMSRWLQYESTELAFTPADIEAASVETITIEAPAAP